MKIIASPKTWNFAKVEIFRTITRGNKITKQSGMNHHLKWFGSVVLKAAFRTEVI